MKTDLQAHARELGFDLCRVTSATPPDHGTEFNSWLASGKHGEMAWLQRNAHRRLDPQQVLPGARSIVCLAASYGPGKPAASSATHSSPNRPNGLIARYARHGDYHVAMGRALEKLNAVLIQLGGPDTRAIWYVDTGPLLERDLAQRAGLGFVGKHTNLIGRQLGNWFLLGEIITTLQLEPDRPEKNHCGRCTACLEACPTRAITAPFQLDARRCISYLTIELKGSIPTEFRPAIGQRIFGCDDCLAVCPWNRFARDGRIMREQYRSDLEKPDLLELLRLDDAAFKQRFAGTPILRTKRRGLLRNVCVALGNMAGQESLPALDRATRDAEPLIQEHARWAITEIERRTSSPPA